MFDRITGVKQDGLDESQQIMKFALVMSLIVV